jgi:hypothetical protein
MVSGEDMYRAMSTIFGITYMMKIFCNDFFTQKNIKISTLLYILAKFKTGESNL